MTGHRQRETEVCYIANLASLGGIIVLVLS
jgi:hypothetical protein